MSNARVLVFAGVLALVGTLVHCGTAHDDSGAPADAQDAGLGIDGATVLADGAILLPDGAIVQADGAPLPSPDSSMLDAGPTFVPTGPPGSLDTSFAGVGYVLGVDGGVADKGASVAVDSQSRIVVGGSVGGVGGIASAIWRFTEPGAPDATFGTSGRWSRAGTTGDVYEFLSGVCVDPEDRPYGTGGANTAGTMLLYRLTSSGVLDTAFHGTGFVTATATTGTGADRGMQVACAPGASVVAGTGGYDVIAWRYLASGALDTGGFHSPNGFVTSHIPTKEGFGGAVAIDGSGRTLLAGFHSSEGAHVWRYSTAGELDSSFGAGGIATFPPTVAGSPSGVAVDASGRVYVSAFVGSPEARGWVFRFTAAGLADATFGNGGGVALPPAAGAPPATPTRAHGLALDATGRVLVAGTIGNGGVDVANETKLAVWRVTPSGTLDAAFGTGGLVALARTGGLPGYPTEGAGVAVDRFNRAVITGTTFTPDVLQRMVVWRLNP